MAKILNIPIQLLRGTAARWLVANPVLLAGQPGVETDTGQMKIGDGTRKWTELSYVGSGVGGDAEFPPHTHVIADITDLGIATTTVAGLVLLAEDGDDTAGLALQASDQRLVTVESLQRSYLLLLKHFVILGLPPPAGLEDDLPLALEME
jgi:hypothetical protein